jgi:hypothetical protein
MSNYSLNISSNYGVDVVAATRSYASLSAAESSGDSWIDGDTVQIVGGATFVYKSALDTNGHSGLIHADPFDDGTSLDSITLRNNEGPNTDPDSWTGWNDNNGGSAGVDYEHDVSTYSRMRKLTTDGRAGWLDQTLNTADVEYFVIVRDVHLDGTQTGGNRGTIYCTSYQDASNWDRVLLAANIATDSTNWCTYNGAYTATSKPLTTRAHVWLYCTDGKAAVWFDGDAAPVWSGTPDAIAGSRGYDAGPLAGSSGSTGTATLTLSTFLNGGMTTS